MTQGKVDGFSVAATRLCRISLVSTGLSLLLTTVTTSAFGQCVPPGPSLSAGAVVSCTGTQTTRLGQGPGADSVNVTLNPGATISTSNTNAISLGNNANITVGSPGGVATATATTYSTGGSGPYNIGNNTIEFNNNSAIVIYRNGFVAATGTQNNSEAINAYGSGNTITNYGTIQGGPSSAIFFENANTTASSPRNVVDNYGLITLVGPGNNPTTQGQAVGSFNNVGIDFINETGAVVNGNLDLQGGNDRVTLNAGSRITGSLDGGGGNNLLTLNAVAGSSDTLPGNVKNFQTLDKTGPGTWTLTGTIGDNGGATPLTVNVIGGTLALTGNNANFNGSIFINPGSAPGAPGPDPTATLEAPAQSLPPLVTDHGVLLVNQADNEAYSGLVQGTGVLTKIGAGTLTLTGANTYAGGTNFNGGFIAVAADSALGASSGPLTFNGGGLQLLSSFNLSPGRAITLQSGGGTIDSNGFTTTVSQAFAGPGGLTVVNSAATQGTVILNALNTFAGPTNVAGGALAVGDPSHASAAIAGGGPVSVASGATLGGYGGVAGDVTSAGTVAVANVLKAFAGGSTGTFTIGGSFQNDGAAMLAGSSVGNILAVSHNYAAGPGATLELATLINEGGPLSNQVTDRLLVAGNAAGVTSVLVRAFGSGAITTPEVPSPTHGVSIIQVAGSSSVGAFTLAGGYVDGGTPYRYQLYAYGPGSPYGAASASQSLVGGGAQWDYRLENVYVSSVGPELPNVGPTGPERPELAPQVPGYISLPTALFNAGIQDIDSLHRRLGEIRDDQALGGVRHDGEIYLRGYGGGLDYTSNRSFVGDGFNSTQNYQALQFGADWVQQQPNGELRLGLSAALGWLQVQPKAIDGQSSSNFERQTVLATATWQTRSGWYLDGILAGGLFQGYVSTAERGRTLGVNGNSFAASLESGYPIPLGFQDLTLEPQAQIIFQNLNFSRKFDTDSIDVDFGDQTSWVLRAGARLIRPFQTQDGTNVTPYLKANLLQGFGASGNVFVGETPFATGRLGTSAQFGAGATGSLTKNIALYGDVTWQTGVASSGFRGWAGNLGLRYAF